MAKNMGGGGYGSRNIVRPGVRNGTPGRGWNPGNVGQIGQMLGEHSTESGGGLRGAYEPPSAPRPAAAEMRLGNEVATNVGKGGPGSGRQVMKTGSQGTHGEVNRGSPPPHKQLFPGWP
jgi:hypothetical protein